MHTVIASDDKTVAERITQGLARKDWTFQSAEQIGLHGLLNHIQRTPPDLLIVVLPVAHVVLADEESISVEQALRGRYAEIVDVAHFDEELINIRQAMRGRLVVVGPPETKLILRTLNHVGADFYLDVDNLDEELLGLMRRLDHSDPGKVIAVVSPAGGSGSTTLACNLATALAQQHGSCGLLDLDLSSGALTSLLDLKPDKTLADFCRHLDHMDHEIFTRMLQRHDSGVQLLAAPLSYEDVDFVTPEGVAAAVSLTRGMFRHVVLDLDHTFRKEQLEALHLADEILVVFQLEFAVLKNVMRMWSYLEKRGIDMSRVRLIVNRYGLAKQVSLREAENALGRKVTEYLPEDPKTVNRCNNNGVPMVLDRPTATLSRKITQLAVSLNSAVR